MAKKLATDNPKRKLRSTQRRRGLSKYHHALLTASQKDVMPGPDEMKTLGLAMKNHLLDLDGPTQTRIGPRTQKQIYRSKLFYGFVEVVECLEMLEDIAFMARKFPYPESRISPDRYLRFLVEAHYGELYILRSRLEQYLTMIQRQFKGDPRHSSIRTTCTKMMSLLHEAVDGVLKIRHNHIHIERFSDKGIDRLKTIGLIANNSRGRLARLMKGYYRTEYVTLRNKWLKSMRHNNKGIRKLLDFIAKHLVGIVFDERTLEFKYPASYV